MVGAMVIHEGAPSVFRQNGLPNLPFPELVKAKWKDQVDLPDTLTDLKQNLHKWNRKLENVQLRLATRPSNSLEKLNSRLHDKLNCTLEKEELIWWRNNIASLQIEPNKWCVDRVLLENHAIQFYKNLYAPVLLEELSPMNRGGFPRLSHANLLHLNLPFEAAEIERAISDMGALKASGIDGFQPIFY
ncbi:hypothetical protein V2J09_016754 [Rumex salicifolius]